MIYTDSCIYKDACISKSYLKDLNIDFDRDGVYAGTIAAGDNKLDYTSDNAFVEFGVDISAYQTGRHAIKITDAAGKVAKGYISSTAPGGEALGADILSGWDFTVGWGTSNCTINDANTYTLTSTAGFPYKALLTVGRVYKSTLQASGTVSFTQLQDGVGVIMTLDGGVAKYATATNIAVRILSGGTIGQSADVDSATCEPLTDCAATGALIVSTLGGSTRSWTSVDTGFNPNLACTYKIYRVR